MFFPSAQLLRMLAMFRTRDADAPNAGGAGGAGGNGAPPGGTR